MEMVINWIRRDQKEDGSIAYIGGDARTHVWATYTVKPSPWAPSAKVNFMPAEQAILDASYRSVKILMELAKFLAESTWTEDEARETLFGTTII